MVVRRHALPPCLLPLELDNGVFLATLVVGGQRIRACIDTGSQYLIVSGKGCGTCGSDFGQYDPSTPSGALALNAQASEMRFGTQQETVEWRTDSLDLIGELAVGRSTCSDDVGVSDAVRIPRMTFGMITHHRGDTAYNVLGLSSNHSRCFRAPSCYYRC